MMAMDPKTVLTILYVVLGALGAALVFFLGHLSGNPFLRAWFAQKNSKGTIGFAGLEGSDGQIRMYQVEMPRAGEVKIEGHGIYSMPDKVANLEGFPFVVWPESNSIAEDFLLKYGQQKEDAVGVALTYENNHNDPVGKSSALTVDSVVGRLAAVVKMQAAVDAIREIMENLNLSKILAGLALLAVIISTIWLTMKIGDVRGQIAIVTELANRTAAAQAAVIVPKVV